MERVGELTIESSAGPVHLVQYAVGGLGFAPSPLWLDDSGRHFALVSSYGSIAPEAWGLGVASALIDEAKRISPAGLNLHVNKDNARAIRFYEKHGFVISGEALNWRSGAPVHKMSWRP